ncbi:hypothetical protein [Erythrobacter sp. YT30]|uniref:hypothetical protein n=1 Tax=Erythrobacter sp. YT30 TaxID=1735012 RepID=UPI00076C0DC3|nr:hypothetical protein [Erythrobacter sp. YT30]KWV90851.1 hypothetical protein AUC45_05760 [Erythrobacter sp. YT30]
MGWEVVVVVAIIIWGGVQVAKARAGIITDEDGNETLARPDPSSNLDAIEDARREIEALRERVKVLERIATDNNTLSAREQARIASEIEALRDKDPGAVPTRDNA